MPFCNKCGTEVAEGINFCGKCGNALNSAQSPSQTNYTVSGTSGGTPFVMEKQFLVGLVALVLGIVGVVYSWITISSDMGYRYTYKPPLTNHEITMIAVLIISIIVAIAGGITLRLKKNGKKDLSLSPPDGDLGDDIDAQVLCEEMNRKRKRNAVLVIIGTVVVCFILLAIMAATS